LLKSKQIAIVIPYCLIKEKLHLWMQTRNTQDELHGMLEFPGGKVEPFENAEVAAVREVQEEVGVSLDLKNLELYQIVSHEINNKCLSLNLFLYHDYQKVFPPDGWLVCKDLSDLNKIQKNIPKINYSFLAELLVNRDFSKLHSS
jgi:8-oxo-dGTP diphosphatase